MSVKSTRFLTMTMVEPASRAALSPLLLNMPPPTPGTGTSSEKSTPSTATSITSSASASSATSTTSSRSGAKRRRGAWELECGRELAPKTRAWRVIPEELRDPQKLGAFIKEHQHKALGAIAMEVAAEEAAAQLAKDRASVAGGQR